MATSLRTAGVFAAWIVIIAALGLITVFFWPFIGLILAVVVPLAIIASVVRSLVRELRGQRHRYPIDGVIGLSHIPQRAKKIRHYTTRGVPLNDDE